MADTRGMLKNSRDRSGRRVAFPASDLDAVNTALLASSIAPQNIKIDQSRNAGVDDFVIIEREPIRVADENDALIPKQPAHRGSGKVLFILTHFGKNTAKTLYKGGVWVKNNKLRTLIALVTAAPNALLAFTSHPENLRKLVARMGKRELVFALSKSLSSLTINAIMNAYFLTTAVDKIKNIMSRMSDGPKQFAEGLIVLTLGAAAAIASGALAYNSFLWLPMAALLAAAPAIISMSIYFASRMIAVQNAFIRIRTLVDSDARAQLELADKLKRVNPDYNRIMEQGLEDIKAALEQRGAGTELTNTDFDNVYIHLAKLISAQERLHGDFLRDPSNKEIAANYGKLGLQIFYCAIVLTLCAFPYALTFSLMGKKGIHILLHFIGKIFGADGGLDNLPQLAQVAFGAPSGLATYLFAAGPLLNAPNTTTRIFRHLAQNPHDIPNAVVLLGANILSAFGPANTAANVADSVALQGLLRLFFILSNTITGFTVNSGITGEKWLLPASSTVSQLNTSLVVERLQDPFTHRIGHTAATTIRQPNSPTTTPPATHHIARMQSTPGT